MNQVVATPVLPHYLEQSSDVRARLRSVEGARRHPRRAESMQAFGSGERMTTALNDISFSTHRREFLCVIGPSGCGKSTLVRILAGLEEKTCGQVLLQGKPVDGPGPDRGMVFQGYTLFPWLTVKKNVMFGLGSERPWQVRSGESRLAVAPTGRPRQVRRRLSASVVGRHETAGRDRPRARQSAARSC